MTELVRRAVITKGAFPVHGKAFGRTRSSRISMSGPRRIQPGILVCGAMPDRLSYTRLARPSVVHTCTPGASVRSLISIGTALHEPKSMQRHGACRADILRNALPIALSQAVAGRSPIEIPVADELGERGAIMLHIRSG